MIAVISDMSFEIVVISDMFFEIVEISDMSFEIAVISDMSLEIDDIVVVFFVSIIFDDAILMSMIMFDEFIVSN